MTSDETSSHKMWYALFPEEAGHEIFTFPNLRHDPQVLEEQDQLLLHEKLRDIMRRELFKYLCCHNSTFHEFLECSKKLTIG